MISVNKKKRNEIINHKIILTIIINQFSHLFITSLVFLLSTKIKMIWNYVDLSQNKYSLFLTDNLQQSLSIMLCYI